MDVLPVLVSIPHGGLDEPDEISGRVNLSEEEILGESDAFTRRIYDLGDRVRRVIKAEVARAIIDLNRDAERLPPSDYDGVIKDVTTYGVAVYKPGKAPGPDLIEHLLERYYEPYFEKIEAAIRDESLELCIDCHSMAAVGPTLAKDAGERRPMLCLGNAFGKSCSDETLERLRDCFAKAFDLPREEVGLNSPFPGGHITRTYGNNPRPWVQIEMSRAMYLTEPWFDRQALKMDKGRLAELNSGFEAALRGYFAK